MSRVACIIQTQKNLRNKNSLPARNTCPGHCNATPTTFKVQATYCLCSTVHAWDLVPGLGMLYLIFHMPYQSFKPDVIELLVITPELCLSSVFLSFMVTVKP